MPESFSTWEINSSSQYHFHEWPDGVAVYLEGEGGTYLLNPFAAELLRWLMTTRMSSRDIAVKLLDQYPDDTLENITDIVEKTIGELRTHGLVVRVAQ